MSQTTSPVSRQHIRVLAGAGLLVCVRVQNAREVSIARNLALSAACIERGVDVVIAVAGVRGDARGAVPHAATSTNWAVVGVRVALVAGKNRLPTARDRVRDVGVPRIVARLVAS